MMYEVAGRIYVLVVIHDDNGLAVVLTDSDGREAGRIDVDTADMEPEWGQIDRQPLHSPYMKPKKQKAPTGG